MIPKFWCSFKYTLKVDNILSFSVVGASPAFLAVVPTLYDLEKELCLVKNWQQLAICLGLEQYEVEAIKKDEQVCHILLYRILS